MRELCLRDVFFSRFANPSEKRRNASQITSSFGVEEETGFESKETSLSGGEGDYNSNCQPYQSTQQCNRSRH